VVEPFALTAIHDLDKTETQSILVVEDDLDLARVMITALQARGIRTLHSVTGAGAIALCAQHEPSLIVLDVALPDIDGYAVIASLRKNPTLKQTALLVYSALDVGSADQARLLLGPTEFLTKSRCSLADFEKHVIGLLDAVAKREGGEQNAA
jgi:CheY-like chemotaxis protein